MLWAGVLSRAALFSVEFVAIGGMSLMLLRRRRTADVGVEDLAPPERSPWIWALRLAAGVGVVCLCLSFSETIATNPNGEWDAFSIWNVRAKYLAGGGPTWRNAVASNLAAGMAGGAHPGYTVVVSASIAQGWTLTGADCDVAPAAVRRFFTVGTI